eukprot:7277904-Lingulodinium_polyedra.AAC.1
MARGVGMAGRKVAGTGGNCEITCLRAWLTRSSNPLSQWRWRAEVARGAMAGGGCNGPRNARSWAKHGGMEMAGADGGGNDDGIWRRRRLP